MPEKESAPEEIIPQLIERGDVNPEQVESLLNGGAKRDLKALIKELETEAGRGEN